MFDQRPQLVVGLGRCSSSKVFELDGSYIERMRKPSLKEKYIEPAIEAQEDIIIEEEPTDTMDEPAQLSHLVGWDVEELYTELLWEALNMVGSDAAIFDERAIFSYLRDAFNIEEEKHEAILEMVKSRKAPNILLYVEAVKATDLEPSDVNGLSDPFCTLFLSSAPEKRYITSIKSQTLNPVWNEVISLAVRNTPDETLHIECWDFDPIETVSDKVTKLGEVKGVKGIKLLIKEIAVSATCNEHCHDFIGSSKIPLKTIPASGETFLCDLVQDNKEDRKGVLEIKLTFSPKNYVNETRQERGHLLRVLLLQELKDDSIDANPWNGRFSKIARIILRQHIVQRGISHNDDILAQWIEFVSVHLDNPLNFQLFSDLAKIIVEQIISGWLCNEEIKLFWDGAKKLLPSCLNNIKKLRKLSPGERSTKLQIEAILTILSELTKVEQAKNLDLFPSSVYNWISDSDSVDGQILTIRDILSNAISHSAVDWFQHIDETNKPEESTHEAQLKHLLNIIQSIKNEQQRAIDYFDDIFHRIMVFPYSKILFITYENKVSGICEPLVKDLCKTLKGIDNCEGDDRFNQLNKFSDALAVESALFHLYLELKTFQGLGAELCLGEMESLQINKYHTWFKLVAPQWLDVEVHTAKERVKKAVELDTLTPEFAEVKHSSSAVDIIYALYPIKASWKQLDWPEVEDSCALIAKIVNDVGRCCVYYADTFCEKVEQFCSQQITTRGDFFISDKWCLAINNIDYVQKYVQPFANELGMEHVFKTLASIKNPSIAESCRQTLQLVIDNAVDTIKKKMFQLLELITIQMRPTIRRMLIESSESITNETASLEQLIEYLDENLTTLHIHLSDDNFQRILNIIWDKLINLINDLVEDGKDKNPSYFANILGILNKLTTFFKYDAENHILDSDTNNKVLLKLKEALSLQSMETWEVIHQYHLERFKEQEATTETNYGMLTVRLQFADDYLNIDILNGRNLLPMDSNGSSDPYVKIHLEPKEKFTDITTVYKTKTHKENLFPLFDEEFSIPLSRKQFLIKDALIHFLVKDEDNYGWTKSDFMGEAFYPFNKIQSTSAEVGLEEMPQIHLRLSKPTKLDTTAIKVLEHRRSDKLAREFIKREKAKASN